MDGGVKSPQRSNRAPPEDLRGVEAEVEGVVEGQPTGVGAEAAQTPLVPHRSCKSVRREHRHTRMVHCYGMGHPRKGTSRGWTSEVP